MFALTQAGCIPAAFAVFARAGTPLSRVAAPLPWAFQQQLADPPGSAKAALATSPKALTIAVADAVAGSPAEPMAAGRSCDAWLDGAVVVKETVGLRSA